MIMRREKTGKWERQVGKLKLKIGKRESQKKVGAGSFCLLHLTLKLIFISDSDFRFRLQSFN